MLVNIKRMLHYRDHTERMLKGMGAEIFTDNEGFINIKPLTSHLKPLNITVLEGSAGTVINSILDALKEKLNITLR